MTMLLTQSICFARSRRGFAPRGFTLVELLVVIAIIGTLSALVLSGVQMARAAARRTQCINNMGQIAKAMTNYETAKQSFPGYVQPLQRSKRAGVAAGQKEVLIVQINGLSESRFGSATTLATLPGDASLISWAAMILNEIEQSPVYDVMVDSTIPSTDDRALIRPIAAYRCPDDTELASVQGNAGLSYSANTGTWDWYNGNNPATAPFNATSFKDDHRANGVFHNLTFGKVKMDSGDISKGDGTENTLLFAENIQKETEANNAGYTWAGIGPRSTDLTEAYNSPGEQQFGVVWLDPAQYGGTSPNPPPADRDWSPFTSGVMAPFSMEGNAPGYPPTTPQFARPSSNHPGVFNAVMASTSVKPIATTIDYGVYQRLLTVNGRKCVEPVNHNASAFQTLPPLAADDY